MAKKTMVPVSTTQRVREYRERTADEFERLQLRLRAGTKERLLQIAEGDGFKSITAWLEWVAQDAGEKKSETSKKRR